MTTGGGMGGEVDVLWVDVRAQTNEQSFRQMEKAAAEAGERAGSGFGDKFKNALGDLKLDRALDDSSVKQFRKGLQDLEQQLEAELKTLEKGTDAYRERARQLADTRAELESLGSKGAGVGEMLKSGVGAGIAALPALAATAAAAVGAALVGGIKSAVDVAQQARQGVVELQASLGVTGEEAQRLGEVAKTVFGNNWTGSLAEAQAAVANVRREVQGLTDTELQAVTEGSVAIAQRFDEDQQKVAAAVQSVMKATGSSAQEALDFITAGFQRGLNSSGDFLDTLNEYGPQFEKAKTTGGELFSLLETGAAKGALGTDKIADSFKEFGFSLADGSEGMVAAFADLGIEQGELTKKIDSGAMTQTQAYQLVMDKLKGVQSETKRMEIMSMIFKGAGEDLGAVAGQIDLTKTKMGDLSGATQQVKDSYNTLGSVFQAAWRQVLLQLQPVGDLLLDLANEAMPAVKQAINTLGPVVTQVVQVIVRGFQQARDGVGPIGQAINAVRPTVSALGDLFQSVFGLISSLWQNVLRPALTAILPVVTTAFQGVSGVLNSALTLISGVVNTVSALFRGDWGQAWEIFKRAATDAANGLQDTLDGIGRKIVEAGGAMFGKAAELGGKIRDGILNGVQNLKYALASRVTEAMNGLLSYIPDWAKNMLGINGPVQMPAKPNTPGGTGYGGTPQPLSGAGPLLPGQQRVGDVPTGSAKNAFDTVFNIILAQEGGFQAMPGDPGNWVGGKLIGTKYGISARSYPTLDIPNLTQRQAKDIYYKDYWLKSGASGITDPALALVHMDTAINSGPGRAAQLLKESNGDFNKYLDLRLAWMKTLKTWDEFGKGWTRRIGEIRAQAQVLAGTPAPPKVSTLAGVKPAQASDGLIERPVPVTVPLKPVIEPKDLQAEITNKVKNVEVRLQLGLITKPEALKELRAIEESATNLGRKGGPNMAAYAAGAQAAHTAIEGLTKTTEKAKKASQDALDPLTVLTATFEYAGKSGLPAYEKGLRAYIAQQEKVAQSAKKGSTEQVEAMQNVSRARDLLADATKKAEKQEQETDLQREQRQARELASRRQLESDIKNALDGRLKAIIAAGVREVGDGQKIELARAELARREEERDKKAKASASDREKATQDAARREEETAKRVAAGMEERARRSARINDLTRQGNIEAARLELAALERQREADLRSVGDHAQARLDVERDAAEKIYLAKKAILDREKLDRDARINNDATLTPALRRLQLANSQTTYDGGLAEAAATRAQRITAAEKLVTDAMQQAAQRAQDIEEKRSADVVRAMTERGQTMEKAAQDAASRQRAADDRLVSQMEAGGKGMEEAVNRAQATAAKLDGATLKGMLERSSKAFGEFADQWVAVADRMIESGDTAGAINILEIAMTDLLETSEGSETATAAINKLADAYAKLGKERAQFAAADAERVAFREMTDAALGGIASPARGERPAIQQPSGVTDARRTRPTAEPTTASAARGNADDWRKALQQQEELDRAAQQYAASLEKLTYAELEAKKATATRGEYALIVAQQQRTAQKTTDDLTKANEDFAAAQETVWAAQASLADLLDTSNDGPYQGQLDMLGKLKAKYPELTGEIDKLIAKYGELNDKALKQKGVEDGINKWANYAKNLIPVVTGAMETLGGVSSKVAGEWASDLGNMVSDLTNFGMAIAKGDYLGAAIQALTTIFGWFSRNKRAAEEAAKATADYNKQFKFSQDGYGTRTTDSYTTGFLFWSTTHYTEQIDTLKRDIALAMEGGFANGIKDGFSQAIAENDFSLFEKSLKASVGKAVLDGLIEQFINQAVIAKIIGPAIDAYLQTGDQAALQRAITDATAQAQNIYDTVLKPVADSFGLGGSGAAQQPAGPAAGSIAALQEELNKLQREFQSTTTDAERGRLRALIAEKQKELDRLQDPAKGLQTLPSGGALTDPSRTAQLGSVSVSTTLNLDQFIAPITRLDTTLTTITPRWEALTARFDAAVARFEGMADAGARRVPWQDLNRQA